MKRLASLSLGNRVRLIIPFDGLACGRCGTIDQILVPGEVYRVRFDDEPRLRLVYGPDLELEQCEQMPVAEQSRAVAA